MCENQLGGAIRTKVRRGALMDMVNVRLIKYDGTMLFLEERMDTIRNVMQCMWTGLTCVVKLNCNYGSVLAHKTTEQHRCHHALSNNASVFDTPTVSDHTRMWRSFVTHTLVDIE